MRISMGGGGTDLPSFYKKFGSEFVSAAIDKYIYIIVQERRYYNEFLLKYSKTESAKEVSEIKNNIIRESLRLLKIRTPLEIVPISDIGGETGLGSSGAFTVGLLNALHTYKREVVSQKQLAEEACHIAIDILKQPSGKQDEYIAAFGGLTVFKISKNGNIKVLRNKFDENFVRELEHLLYMFFTGIRRKSKTVLAIQKSATNRNNKEVINNLKEVQKLGLEIISALKNKNANKFGRLLHEHWLLKRQRAKTTNNKIDRWYNIARENGAVGGKIMGAGGGGFFLFYCEKDAPHLINILEKSGLKHIPFNFDWNGTRVIANF
jgi:D-glycero-alpha-D-manno-heptose-7-phosphate kinase